MRIIIRAGNESYIKRKKIKDNSKERRVKIYCRSRNPKNDMMKFEKLMKVKCPVCYEILTYASIRTHLYCHGFNNYKIDELESSDGFELECPFCEKYIPKVSKFRKHLRRQHTEKLTSIASGAYHTEDTILKIKKNEDLKKLKREKFKFKVRVVSGGLPSLGKRSR